jgi:hypothetical protein
MKFIYKLLALFFLLSPIVIFAQSVDDSLIVVRKTPDFELTNAGNEPEWESTSFVVLPQRKKSGVLYETKMKILYSDLGMYCLYECEDNKITATLKEDFSDIYNEDVVEAFFWPMESSPIYFEYELSPNNVELPILVPNYNGKFMGWKPWHYEGAKKTRHQAVIRKKGDKVVGWTAQFFIPYKLLEPLQNVPPTKGMKWRANFYRIDYDKGTSSWTWKQIQKNFHDYERFGTIIFD